MSKSYRTKAIAEKSSALTQCPERLAVPTLPNYENSISLHQEGNAYMQYLTISTDGLKFENGEMFFEGALEPISTVELKNMVTNEGIEKIDIPLLTALYNVILTKYHERLMQGETLRDVTSQVTSVYAPDFANYLGITLKGENGGLHKTDVRNIMEKTSKFHNIIGILHITRNGKPDKSYFPVLNFAGYNAEDNTISFFSPYLIYVVRKIFSEALIKDKKGQPKLKRNGFPMLEANHSFLIRPSIVTERNKAAVENVMIIVKVIEQAGDRGTPHIKASTIIERNEALKWRLSKDQNPERLLARVFKRTWELLREETTLQETYQDIELPDPEDKKNIPTPSRLDKIVFEFPHKGKNSYEERSKK